MKTKTQTEQPISSDEETKPEDAVAQPTTRRVAYKTVLAAVVIGIITISLLWGFVIGQNKYLANATPVTEPEIQVHKDTETKGRQIARRDNEYGTINRKLTSISSRIDRGFDAQQIHSSFVKRELLALAEGIRMIKAVIADLGESHNKLARSITEATSRLDILIKDVRAFKIVRRKPTAKHKPRPVKIPPFHIDAIDVWDDVTYVSVSQAGRVAFLKTGEQQSGWTVSKIDRLKGQVDFQGPAGQAHSVLLQR